MNFVSTAWQLVCAALSPAQDFSMMETLPFDACAWESHLDLHTDATPPPPELIQVLENPCPFWPDRKIKNTHLLCLIPKELSFALLFEKTHQRSQIKPMQEIRLTSESYWILITKQLLPGSRDAYFSDFVQQLPQNYSAPTILEAAAAVFAMRKMTGTEIFYTFGTQCLENKEGYPISIASSLSDTFSAFSYDWNIPPGIAGVRRIID